MVLYTISHLVNSMRIDTFLAERGIVSSRTEAKKYIVAGAVSLNGKVILKPSFDVDCESDKIEVDLSVFKYVGRGGIKLERALQEFRINPSGRLCLDVGASSGGFTDCLIKR